MEQELLILSEHLSSLPPFNGVRVTRSLVLYVCFIDRCLSFCTFSFGHCVVCSSIYGFWLPFGIFWPLCCLFFDLRILITHFVSSNSSMCTQYCQFLWIVHSWLPLHLSLTFFICYASNHCYIMYNTMKRHSCRLQSINHYICFQRFQPQLHHFNCVFDIWRND